MSAAESVSQAKVEAPPIDAGLPGDAALRGRELSEQRLAYLASLAQGLHRTIPEFLGMTVYGSTSRGEARPSSDADLFVFIEPAAKAASLGDPRVPEEQPGIILSSDAAPRNYSSHPTYGFTRNIEVNYRRMVVSRLRGVVPSVDLDVLPISEAIVDRSTDALLETAQRWAMGDAGDVSLPDNIRGLFHKPVDTERLQPHIGRVLENLAGSPFGEVAWSAIRRRVVGFEKRRGTAAAAFYSREIPETLMDAQGHFATLR